MSESDGYCADHKPTLRKRFADIIRPIDTSIYNYKWQKARESYLRQHPLCKCGKAATVVDHIIPHRGELSIFWDMKNWQSICVKCHTKKTMKEILK